MSSIETQLWVVGGLFALTFIIILLGILFDKMLDLMAVKTNNPDKKDRFPDAYLEDVTFIEDFKHSCVGPYYEWHQYDFFAVSKTLRLGDNNRLGRLCDSSGTERCF